MLGKKEEKVGEVVSEEKVESKVVAEVQQEGKEKNGMEERVSF